ncbi:hypothetical protein BKA67DRAFT_68721 [Truncatella angustata]|uniref:Heterokaryon incompatibility domain-containing protein n=1 Tax=Truncatella angustata TaxID=152316 RepID=A0A9P8UX10_9PEZI|nr:uncharacterized protein BKA67DRAFT_68721 [Truncatella angustata]KAH6660864.1 hypothetical protein BKA67DRAFT_68721 [Truncatella angustata]
MICKGAGYSKRKVGCVKIDGCYRQALRDGLEYVWIDTCCMDKSSTAELSEAINSMFNRYCRVFIVVSRTEDVERRECGLLHPWAYNVNTLLVYGGGDEVFIRSWEEIMKTSGDQSLFP